MQRSDGRPKSRPRRKAFALPYGVYARARPKPFLVKFTRGYRTVYIGSYLTLAEAATSANNFLLKELSECPSLDQTQLTQSNTSTKMAKTSSQLGLSSGRAEPRLE